MVAKPFDLEKHPPPKYDKDNPNAIIDKGNPLCPRKEILIEYEKVNFPYEKTVEDRLYEQFYAVVKGRPVTVEAFQIHRIRLPGKGEYIFYDATFRGTDWKGNDREFYTVIGKYEKPRFRLEKDPATQEVTSTQISSRETIYDITYSRENLDEILEFATEPIALAIHGSGSRTWAIESLEDFKDGLIEDLSTSAKSGKSLQTILVEKNQFTYEKREQKQQNNKKEAS